MRMTSICMLVGASLLALGASSASAAAADTYASPLTPSQRIARLAIDARERWLDLLPVSETMGSGAGPRQDRLELTFTDPHRERQREHSRWLLRELDAIPLAALEPGEKLSHQLLAQQSRDALECLSYPFHQHYIFIQMNGGVANNEVLRYMAWPGQALGYKIGELTILDIRAKAEQRLGARFDIRAFHDALLAEGHMPLTLARARMAAWVEEQAKKP